MNKIQTKSNKGEKEQYSYIFPKSEEIAIEKNSLHIQLGYFKKAVIEKISFDDLLNLSITLSAAYLPFFTSDFKNVLGISKEDVRGAYVGFVVLITIFCLYRYILIPIKYYFTDRNISSDPEQMAQIILDKCNINKK